jgi:hypothetical protein
VAVWPAVTGLASVALFMAVLFLSGLVAVALRAIATAQGAVAAMRAPGLDDLAREKAVQQASLRLFAAFGGILVRTALCLAAAALPVLAAGALGLATEAEVTGFLMRWDVILILTFAITAGWIAGRRLWPSR